MATTFQLAHCVEEASFASADELRSERRIWAVHEVETTVDFCPRNPVLTWMLGGLNFQIEHHLFPKVPHTHYPKIAEIVRRNCAKHGVRYSSTRPSAAPCARTSSICGRWAGSACRPRSRWGSAALPERDELAWVVGGEIPLDDRARPRARRDRRCRRSRSGTPCRRHRGPSRCGRATSVARAASRRRPARCRRRAPPRPRGSPSAAGPARRRRRPVPGRRGRAAAPRRDGRSRGTRRGRRAACRRRRASAGCCPTRTPSSQPTHDETAPRISAASVRPPNCRRPNSASRSDSA